ncbi:MAG: hypothetical protein AB1547_01570 [Thermodesulfobacteriota bacterium]
MNGFNENTSRLANRAQTSIMAMVRVVSTAVMATVIFVAGIFIGRATVPALFEKDRTEQLLARISHEVQLRKQMLDQLRMKTPAPQVQYPDEFRKENPQGFVPELKTPSVASQTVKPAVPAQPQTTEKPAAAVPSSDGGRPMDSAVAPAPEAVPVEKAPVKPSQVPAAAPPSLTAKPEKPQESAKLQGPASVQGAVSKPQEHAAPIAVGSAGKPGTGGGSLKAMVYSRKTADDLAASLRKRGLTPLVQPRMTRSGVRYEVVVTGLGSASDATTLAGTIRQTYSEAEISVGP